MNIFMDKDDINNMPESGTSAILEEAKRLAYENKAKKDEAIKKYKHENIFGNMEMPDEE